SPPRSARLCPGRRRRHPRPPLLPYTTLFRSGWTLSVTCRTRERQWVVEVSSAFRGNEMVTTKRLCERGPQFSGHLARHLPCAERSEEHTSELQSRENLVCRLLLEKKKHGTDE